MWVTDLTFWMLATEYFVTHMPPKSQFFDQNLQISDNAALGLKNKYLFCFFEKPLHSELFRIVMVHKNLLYSAFYYADVCVFVMMAPFHPPQKVLEQIIQGSINLRTSTSLFQMLPTMFHLFQVQHFNVLIPLYFRSNSLLK